MSNLQQQQMVQQLWLASASPRREQLIKLLALPIPIICQPSEVEESYDSSWSPSEIVEQLSLRKGQAVIDTFVMKQQAEQTNHITHINHINHTGDTEAAYPLLVVGSDTIVVLEGKVMGKPADEKEAKEMLTALQGTSHEVYTGLAVIYLAGDGSSEVILRHTANKVTFHAMSESEIDGYIKTGEPLDKAGSYGIQGLGTIFVEKIEGDFYSIMGLPVQLLYQTVRRFGLSPFL